MAMGKVYLVGAGPGAVDLLTVRAMRVLAQAEVVLYDRLVNPELLDFAPKTAVRIEVGKRRNHSSAARQETIIDMMIHYARSNCVVVRLKGGDPFVFGRGGEEVSRLRQAGIEPEVVPGISSCIAAPGSVLIPVTMRGIAASFGVFAGHPGEDEPDARVDWLAAARIQTAVFLMGVARLDEIVTNLIAHGRASHTPIAIIERATLSGERVVIGRLETIIPLAHGIQPPATIIVGEVVGLYQASARTVPPWAPLPNSELGVDVPDFDRLWQSAALLEVAS